MGRNGAAVILATAVGGLLMGSCGYAMQEQPPIDPIVGVNVYESLSGRHQATAEACGSPALPSRVVPLKAG